MEPFLLQVARRIADEHPRNTDRVLAVFNNNRSKRFFLNQFRALGRPSFLPQVMTIDEFVASLGGLEIVPNEFLLFELYDIHVELEGDDRKYQTFEDFIAFGDLMMADFSEIDQYCVDAAKIFDNLHEIKSIGEWDIEGKPLTERQQRYLAFYRSLYQYYSKLHNRLLAEGKAYGGMAYREVASNIGTLADRCPHEAVYFVGFNAISECERLIISEFCRLGNGHLIADNDVYFLRPEQEAGHFLRKHKEEFPELEPHGTSRFASPGKRITLVECPENILQCKYAAALLSQILANDGEALENTALVIADESLLMPALNALPAADKEYHVNISMGYAFADSAVHALAMKVFSLLSRRTDRGYYHSDILDLMSDRLVADALGLSNMRHRTEAFLRSDSRIRCSADDIEALLRSAGADNPACLRFLFPDHKPAADDCLAILRQLAALIASTHAIETNKKELQALGSLVEVLDNLNLLVSKRIGSTDTPVIGNIETLEKIYSRLARRHSIALIGEPLSGLQILGVLETRNLDFRRVVLLSANEGVLPAGRGNNTLIPYDLKVRYGLPTYAEKDSVYAYNVFRLLSRADEAYLVFSSESDGMGKGEPSRFILQIQSELTKHFDIKVRSLVVKTDPHLQPALPAPTASKTDAILRAIDNAASHGLSPTSFYSYLECPLKYYYMRLLNIRKTDDLDEDLDASELGTCIHGVLEDIYRPLLGKPLKTNDLQHALDNLHDLMRPRFEQFFSHGRSTEGRNSFLHTVAEQQLKHLLSNEISQLQHHDITVLAVEHEADSYPIATTRSGTQVLIKGKVDRIDSYDGVLRIIDYKTGSLRSDELTLTARKKNIPGKWFQLMWYALLYCRCNTIGGPVVSGIYPLGHIRSDVRTASWDGQDILSPQMLDDFEAILRDKIEEMLNPDLAFLPVPSGNVCKFCHATSFCPHTAYTPKADS